MALASALALVAGCARVELPKPDPEPIPESGEGIFFSPSVSSTKAMLDAEDLNQAGTTVKVYDYLTGYTGEIGGVSVTPGQTVKYFDAEIACNVSTSPATWPYVGGKEYTWTKNGTHKFIGWLTVDGTSSGLTAEALFGANQPAFNESTRILSIPTTTMTTTTIPQFDFCYSGVVSQDAATHTTGAAVSLPMNHLFSALQITMKNTSGNKVLLKSVVIRGLKNRRSATIDFTAAIPSPDYANVSAVDMTVFSSNEENGTEYASDRNAEHTLMSYILMWPQSWGDLSGSQIVVKYRIKDSNNTISSEVTSTININSQAIFSTDQVGMDPATRYTFMLQFKESTLDIYTRALPWDYDEYDWDYAENSISARSGAGGENGHDGVLVFYHGTGDNAAPPSIDEWSAKSIKFANRREVMTGRFYIEAPKSGRWRVTPYPSETASYFIVGPTSGEIEIKVDPDTGLLLPDSGLAEFTVRTNPEQVPTASQTLYFSVSIYYNGEWHDANSEFNRKNIKLVLEAN